MYVHHRFDHEFPRGTPLELAYAVCSVPRCGSSLLCELLLLTGVAGAPTEYFDAEQERAFREVWRCGGGDAYLVTLLDRKTSPNGVFGVKLHWGQMCDRFGETGLRSFLPDVAAVRVRRRDSLAQAVSYVIADQTGQWASVHDAGGEARYDEVAIARRLRQVREEDVAWGAWFGRQGISPIEVWYEDLSADPQATVARVLEGLGLDPATAPDPRRATLARQADERTLEWIDRFARTRGSPT